MRFFRTFEKPIELSKIPNDIQKNRSSGPSPVLVRPYSGPSGAPDGTFCPAASRTPLVDIVDLVLPLLEPLHRTAVKEKSQKSLKII